MAAKKKIEIFSAGCSTGKDTIELVKRIAGTSHEVVIHDMQKSEMAFRDGIESQAIRRSECAGRCDRRQARGMLRRSRPRRAGLAFRPRLGMA
jgi:hypothetical protein